MTDVPGVASPGLSARPSAGGVSPAALIGALLAAVLHGCATPADPTNTIPTESPPIACTQCGRWIPVGPDDYAAIAGTGPVDGHNAGAVGNAGLIAGPDGVLLIGTGSSHAHGIALDAAARRVTGRRVTAAVNLQASPEHVLGNGGLRAQRIPVLAHRDTVRFMQRNCERCIRDVHNDIGNDGAPSATIDLPDRVLDGDLTDRSTGRAIDIVYLGHTYQPGSLVVVDREHGVAFTGNLVSIDRVPDVANADLDQWLAALARIRRLGVHTIVPGFGPVSPLAGMDELARYLTGLREAVGRSFQAGRSLQATQREAALPAYASWAMYDRLHPKNVQRLYLQMEAAELSNPGR